MPQIKETKLNKQGTFTTDYNIVLKMLNDGEVINHYEPTLKTNNTIFRINEDDSVSVKVDQTYVKIDLDEWWASKVVYKSHIYDILNYGKNSNYKALKQILLINPNFVYNIKHWDQLSELEIDDLITEFDYKGIMVLTKLKSESFVDKYAEQIYWPIYSELDLSEDIITKYSDHVSWEQISLNKNRFSVDFIKENYEKISWEWMHYDCFEEQQKFELIQYFTDIENEELKQWFINSLDIDVNFF